LSLSSLILGIDEAGRGPIVGPMVIAGFALPVARLGELAELGVRDSKKLTPKRRTEIGAVLRGLPGAVIVEEVVPPEEIDAAVRNRSITLNGLELMKMAAIIERVGPVEAYLDMLGTSEDRFQSSLFRLLESPCRIVAANRGDDRFPVCAAASIIAKTRRDAEIARLNAIHEARYGPIGSGYPGDPKTRAFLAAARAEPGIFRRSWSSFSARPTDA
jgi:ribonuclease HII